MRGEHLGDRVTGTVYTETVVHLAPEAFAKDVPYQVVIVTLEDGTRIYHAGDTAAHADMALIAELYAPEIALLPIGDLYTMSPREAAVAARMLKSKFIVPAHYGTSPALTGTPDALRSELKAQQVDAEVIALRPGETLT